MKKIFGLFLFLMIGLSYGIAQVPDLFASTFTVLEAKSVSAYHSIVSCIDQYSNLVQFEVRTLAKPNPKIIELYKNKLKDLSPGTVVVPDFNTGKIALKSNPAIQYKMVRPVFSLECCSVTKIEQLMGGFPSYLATAKPDTANGLTAFTTIASPNPNFPFHIGQSIYEGNFNNNRYAILKCQNSV